MSRFPAKVKKNTTYFLLNIPILDDNELEGDEKFRVFAPHVHDDYDCNNYATVTIEDNDCKLVYKVMHIRNENV